MLSILLEASLARTPVYITVSIMSDENQTMADLQAALDDLTVSLDLLFVLVMGVICFLLQAGFGLLEVGSIRAKNAQNIMLKNLMDAAVSAIAYYIFGYSFAYGT